jgi:hypothetical protein
MVAVALPGVSRSRTEPDDIAAAELFHGGWFDCWPAPEQKSHAVSLCILCVHRSRRDRADVTGAVGTAIGADYQGQRSIEHKQPRVKLVRVCITVHVWFDLLLAKLVTLALDLGFKLGSVHRKRPFKRVGRAHATGRWVN